MIRRSLIAALLTGSIAPGTAFAIASVKVRLTTELGVIDIALYPGRAPATVANFLAYVDQGLWKGASFYRTVSPANDHNPATINVVQGGLNRDDPPLPPVRHETTRDSGLLHRDGVISMARGAPGTAGADFFICIGDNPALDFGGARNPDGQGFAAFGKVVRGMSVVRAIHKAPTGASGDDAYTKGQILERPVKILDIRRLG